MANVVFGIKEVSTGTISTSCSTTEGHVTFNTEDQTIYYGTGSSGIRMNGLPRMSVVTKSDSSPTGSSTSTGYKYTCDTVTIPGIVVGVVNIGVTGLSGYVTLGSFSTTPTVASSSISTNVTVTVTLKGASTAPSSPPTEIYYTVMYLPL